MCGKERRSLTFTVTMRDYENTNHLILIPLSSVSKTATKVLIVRDLSTISLG